MTDRKCTCGAPVCNNCQQRKPHKHAAVIKEWADGAQIETKTINGWQDCPAPSWQVYNEYRIKPAKPHKWQAVMDAYKAGKPCQFRVPTVNGWADMVQDQKAYGWLEKYEYRVKPERVSRSVRCNPDMWQFTDLMSNLKLTFENGVLIEAEIL